MYFKSTQQLFSVARSLTSHSRQTQPHTRGRRTRRNTNRSHIAGHTPFSVVTPLYHDSPVLCEGEASLGDEEGKGRSRREGAHKDGLSCNNLVRLNMKLVEWTQDLVLNASCCVSDEAGLENDARVSRWKVWNDWVVQIIPLTYIFKALYWLFVQWGSSWVAPFTHTEE